MRTVKREETRTFFKLPENLEIIQVIALGKPNQEVKLVEVKDGATEYFTGPSGEHCVPKRSLSDVIFKG